MEHEFEYCPACSDDLDTGWECNGCGIDWMRIVSLANETAAQMIIRRGEAAANAICKDGNGMA